MTRRFGRVGPLAAMLVLLCSCSVHGLTLLVDDRLTFVEPEDGEAVTLPVTIDWQMEDFEVTRTTGSTEQHGDRGYFAVFVDRSPQPPNEPLTWFARDDEVCQRDPGCPDEGYLAARGVHTTTDTSFTIEALPRPTNTSRRESYEVTVVLLDPDGVRIGESAWRVRFVVDRGLT